MAASSRLTLTDPWRLVKPLTCVLIAAVTIGMVANYGRYFPPDFHAEFLLGRRSYFYDGYHVAFYAHIVAGPISLALAVLLMSARIRMRYPQWHRQLGRTLAIIVLAVLVPSGIAMSFHAISGRVAGTGFAALGVATAFCVSCGWRDARARRFREHQVWMERCCILLSSAVVLRLIAAIATLLAFDAPWLYPASAWGSWVVPLGIHALVSQAAKR